MVEKLIEIGYIAPPDLFETMREDLRYYVANSPS